MDRALLSVVLAALCCASCSPAFKDKRTPSGDYCSDMPIIPAGQDTDREYHRLQPITSDPSARTEAERLESLRKVACKVGADAVIEAVNEEVRGDNASYSTVSSGTAVLWIHRSSPAEPKAEPVAPRKPVPISPPAPPAPTQEPAAAPAKSAKPAAGKPSKPTPINMPRK